MAITLDHINIRTNDLEAVSETLVRTLGLEAGHRPPFKTEGIWLYGNGYPIVHLSKRDFVPGDDTGAVDHIAFKDDDFDGLTARLEAEGIDFDLRVVPASGVRQVFFKVNHDVKIEVGFDPAA